MNQVKQIFSPVLNVLASIGTKFKTVGEFFGKIVSKLNKFGSKIVGFLEKGPIGKAMMKVGKIFGKKMLMPLMMVWNFFKDFGKIKDLFAKGDIVGILKHVASSILEPILDIPEMFINGLSWLFGSKFRVDFGKDAIMGFVDTATAWVFDNITVPVLDFFTIDIPTFFDKIFGIFGRIKEKLSGLAGKIFNKVASFFGLGEDEDTRKEKYEKGRGDGSLKTSMPYDEFGDDMMSSPRDIKTSEVKTYAKIGKKVVDSPPSLLGGTRAKASQVNKQLDATNSTNDKLDQTNTKITETNKTQQIILNQQSMNVEIKDEIPTETENMGVLFMTTSWGVGGA